jgi:D-glycero-alpha-D-manno-heptose-7-phosphate kinase
MIIVRTPLRVSFFGGGTDHPAWFNRPEPGAVLSTTINKYVYVQLRRLPVGFAFSYRAASGLLEEAKTLNDIRHPIVREVLRHYAATNDIGYEIICNADLLSRAGLGSSSAFTVSLLHALFGDQQRLASKPLLAREAIFVEQKLLNEAVGCQDQIAAAYGGLNRIDFSSNGDHRVTPIRLAVARRLELEQAIMLFFTGFTRLANDIERRKIAKFADRSVELRSLYEMVNEGERILVDPSRPLEELGELLHYTWTTKRRLDDSVSNPTIDERYEAGLKAGSLGGKLLGAGGGGFLLMLVPRKRQAAVMAAMRGMSHVRIRMECKGTSILLRDTELTPNYVQTATEVS